jgi:MraZ protein
MSGFLGSYLHQIDDKGRLNLPAQFRRDAPDRPLVLVQVHSDALSLYPETAWSGVEDRLRELLRLQPHARPHVLGLTANALEVVPDRQGRILIPQRMQTSASLVGSALLVGLLDRIEVWNPDRFDATVGARTPEFERFTHQIFG